MKKLVQFCSLLLAVSVLPILCACGPQENGLSPDEPMTSVPTQTLPEESTVFVTEELESSFEVPSQADDETMFLTIDDEEFEIYREDESQRLYHYIGQNQTVIIKDVGLEIKLPEEWVGKVEVIRNARPGYMELFIGNIHLMQAYADLEPTPVEIQRGLGWYDWVLLVQAVRKDNTATVESLDNSEYRIYLGSNDEYQFYFATSEMHDMNCDTFMIIRDQMIRDRGQEYYDNLVGDLTCTVEQAKDILKVL